MSRIPWGIVLLVAVYFTVLLALGVWFIRLMESGPAH